MALMSVIPLFLIKNLNYSNHLDLMGFSFMMMMLFLRYGKTATQIQSEASSLKKRLNNLGLSAEFVAPRLWEDPMTIDGAYTANDPDCRKYAIERSKVSIDIAKTLGTDLLVLWLAREGTYIREAKDSKIATDRLVEAINEMLAHDPDIRICIEPKPNEPMDHAYLPTTGHALAIGMLSDDPDRVGVNIESAHAILAGLDPSDEMGFALAHQKLWTVHLNDQNGIKFDQDKSFGSVDLRRAFNQVRSFAKNEGRFFFLFNRNDGERFSFSSS